MRMINYGYFRHRFDAHTNIKLNKLADEMGVAAYGYYYTLLELYGAKYSTERESLSVDIHLRVIANTWRKRVDSCKRVLTKLQLSGLLVVTISDSTCTIEIPNFLKYYGSYQKTNDKTLLSKEKKSKEKKINNKKPEIQIPKTKIRPDDVVQLWNETMTSNGDYFCHGLGSGEHLKNFIESIRWLPEITEWKHLFEKCKASKFLMGEQENSTFRVSLTWLCDYDNCIKVLNGNFDYEAKKELSLEMDIVDKIMNMAVSYGHTGGSEARKELGEENWKKIYKAIGPMAWPALCNSNDFDRGMMKRSLRECFKS